jgi:hypothetical protein
MTYFAFNLTIPADVLSRIGLLFSSSVNLTVPIRAHSRKAADDLLPITNALGPLRGKYKSHQHD